MDALLLALKFGGILLTGALGVLGTATETHSAVGPDGVRRLNGWGKWVLGLTVTGLVLALGSQVFEELRDRADSEAAQQLATENRAFQLAERTRFSAMQATCVFQLSPADPRTKAFANSLKAIAASPDAAKAAPFGGKIRNGYIRTTLAELASARPESMPGLSEVRPLFDSLPRSLARWMVAQTALPTAFDRSAHADLDLSSEDPFPISDWTLEYASESGRILISTPELEYSGPELHRSGRVAGASDLGNARVCLHLLFSEAGDGLTELAPLLQPVWFRIGFDDLSLTLTSFRCSTSALSPKVHAVSFEATLPGGEVIAAGAEQEPRPR